MSRPIFHSVGLSEDPFRINPDPRFLFATPELQKTIAEVLRGIRARCDVVLLTGDTGTGKTTVANHLTNLLRDEGAATALVSYSHVDAVQLVELARAGFGLPGAIGCKGSAAQMARSGGKVMQFLNKGQYVANVVDGNVTLYGGSRRSSQQTMRHNGSDCARNVPRQSKRRLHTM